MDTANEIILQDTRFPLFAEGKLFYWVFESTPVVGRRYFLTQNREINSFITRGIDLYMFNPFVPQFPGGIVIQGKNYFVLPFTQIPNVHVTWYDKEGNWLEYRKPLMSYYRFPSTGQNQLREFRQYNYRIFPPKSYFTFVDTIVTPTPFVIPMVFYWD